MMTTTMMIETTTSVRVPPSTFCYTTATCWSLPQEVNTTTAQLSSRRLLGSRYRSTAIPWNKFRRLRDGSLIKRGCLRKSRIQASIENLGSDSDSSRKSSRLQYHPFEEIAKSASETSGDARLIPQETARTIVEAKSKATLMFTGVLNDDMHENIIWPDLPYVTDEHGNIYFQVKNDEDILQTLTSENNFVQVIIGFDAMEMLSEMESLGSSDIDFGVEEIEDEDGDVEESDDEDEDEDDDYDEDVVAVLDDEDEEDDSDETVGDWAKLETMRSSHPMYFAKKLAQVASDDPVDWMEQPPAGLAIQGLIRPAFIEEQSDIQRHMSSNQSREAGTNQVEEIIEDKLEDPGVINGHKPKSGSSADISMWAQESDMDDIPRSGTSFYRLEMTKIQLILANGHQTVVEVEDFRKAQPDAIALSADKIISRLKAGGENITQAFKSLCWRCKGIQVEEAAVIEIDSLGFDLRVCSGVQIQTLRFVFNSQATSEYSAERQLNNLLFPRIHHRLPKKKQTQQNEH